jgi:hypothetical protein
MTDVLGVADALTPLLRSVPTVKQRDAIVSAVKKLVLDERNRCADLCMKAYKDGGEPGSWENKQSARLMARRLADRISDQP